MVYEEVTKELKALTDFKKKLDKIPREILDKLGGEPLVSSGALRYGGIQTKWPYLQVILNDRKGVIFHPEMDLKSYPYGEELNKALEDIISRLTAGDLNDGTPMF